MSAELEYTVWSDLTFKTCPVCGINYALPTVMHNERLNSKEQKNWYCPNGHSLVFRDNDTARIQRKLDEMTRDRDWQKQRAEKADRERKKVERRIHAGVCPKCQRTFTNVARHMETKHPLETKPNANP